MPLPPSAHLQTAIISNKESGHFNRCSRVGLLEIIFRKLCRLQLVQNAAAKTVTLTNRRDLHWLNVNNRISCKILSLAYSCFSRTSLQRLLKADCSLRLFDYFWGSHLHILSVDNKRTQTTLARALSNATRRLGTMPSDRQRTCVFLCFSQKS